MNNHTTKIFFAIIMVMLCGCSNNTATKTHPQTRNYNITKCNIITTEGDTIEFYGGQLDYIVTQRSWRLSNINVKNYE